MGSCATATLAIVVRAANRHNKGRIVLGSTAVVSQEFPWRYRRLQVRALPTLTSPRDQLTKYPTRSPPSESALPVLA
jgi:hypothetical protein